MTTDQLMLSPAQLAVVREALDSAASLEPVARECGFDNPVELLSQVGQMFHMPFVELADLDFDPEAIAAVPAGLIHRHKALPIDRQEGCLRLAIANPFSCEAMDSIAASIGMQVTPVLASPEELQRYCKKFLGVGAETIDSLVAQQSDEGVELLDDVEFDGSEAAEEAQQASVVRLVNEILCEAVEARTSDIHLESLEEGMQIRYRIDGVLQRQPVPAEIHRFRAAIISRLKIMARLNIAERRVPQDGRIKVRVSGREVDIRLSIIPMLHGEGVVMRVLDKNRMDFSLRGIGMEQSTYDAFQRLIQLPHGIVLVTGPTGSGKTTTLYSALAEIKDDETKIVTTEDPIEYQLAGINQIQVHSKVGLTFAASLRAILRHDPDVVLVGEIRDLETAENAIQASLTGHLVFSTLHTNDSAGAFTRLIDMGVEPFLVSSTVEGILAQRLVRTLCEHCRTPYRPPVDKLPEDFPRDAFERGETVYQPNGCRECRGTGYNGRVGLYELLVVNDEIRKRAGERAPATEIRRLALKQGLRTLRDDGWDRVLKGQTSIDEVLRVTRADESTDEPEKAESPGTGGEDDENLLVPSAASQRNDAPHNGSHRNGHSNVFGNGHLVRQPLTSAETTEGTYIPEHVDA